MLKTAALVALMVGFASCATPHQTSSPPPRESGSDSLRQEVAHLKDQVARLEKQLGHPQGAANASPVREVHGVIACPTFRVEQNERVLVTDDVEIASTDDIIIDGDLIVCARLAGSQTLDAPNITLKSGRSIRVRGTILGARGISVPMDSRESDDIPTAPAGKGTDIVLDSALTIIDGYVIAGDGGDSLPRGMGGRGGDVTIQGNAISFVDDDRPEILGGAGGNAARGGNVSVLSERPVDSGVLRSILIQLATERRANVTKQRSGGSSSSPLTACSETPANPGGHGVDVQGGTGGNGNQGSNGTITSPDGQTGFPGLPGGVATPGSGVVGDTGMNCCDQNPQTGGKGGTGGRAGQGVGGTGGTGGRGGNAYKDPATHQYLGDGGTGGTGGPAGPSNLGTPGTGGPGGPKGGQGGNGGPATMALAGSGGAGGAGGRGIQPGDPGPQGTAGAPADGGTGATGAKGGLCVTPP